MALCTLQSVMRLLLTTPAFIYNHYESCHDNSVAFDWKVYS